MESFSNTATMVPRIPLGKSSEPSLLTDDIPQKLHNDLIQASSKNPSIFLELDMDCNVIHLSKAWEYVVGTSIRKIADKSISRIVYGTEEDKNVFNEAISIMMTDDTSYRVRFITATNEIRSDLEDNEFSSEEIDELAEEAASSPPRKQQRRSSNGNESLSSISTNGEWIELEGQGILIHDSSGIPKHSVWILKPFFPNSLNVQLPTKLAETLGFGADIFTSFLSSLSEMGIINEDDVPSPPTVLCRICEQQVPSWWIETHSRLCYNEHKYESDVQIIHDELLELKQVVSGITESLNLQAVNDNGEISEYRGLVLPKVATHSENAVRPSSSLSTKRGRSNSLFGTLRFPFKTLALLSDLLERAIEINPSEYNDHENKLEFSPNTKKALSQVFSSEIPSSLDPAINLLSEDVKRLSKDKADAVSRLNSSLIFSQKIKREVDDLVLNTVSETVKSIRNQTYDVQTSDLVNQKADNGFSKNSSSAKQIYGSSISDLSQPHPKPVPSNIFSNAYLQTDSLPNPLSHQTNESISRDTLSPSRSITPNEVVNKGYSMEKEAIISFTDLNIKSPVLTPQRRPSPSPLQNFHNSPMSSIQRNPKILNSYQDIYLSGSTPTGSPIILAHDPEDGIEKKTGGLMSDHSSSVGNLGRPPLSPLLSAVPASKHSTLSIKDYEILKPISKGAFGSVYLARRRVTGDYYAIKVLKKADMIAKNQVTNVKAERAVMMAQSDSPYVAKLFSSFQSKDCLFLVMEYLPGGDCSTLVKMLGNLPDHWAKQYIAEVISGVEDMHSKGIVHHDLKPDNLLISSSGHLKLTDFGLSRMGLVRRQERMHDKSISISDESFNHLVGNDLQRTSMQRKDSIGALHLSSPVTNEVTHVSSSPTPYQLLDFNPKTFVRSDSQGSTDIDSPLLKPLQRSSSQTSFVIQDYDSISTVPLSSTNSGASNQLNSRSLALYDPQNASRNKTFVGTPDYLSPETIMGTGESEVSDWWSVGCILFEFIFGYPPFHDSTPERVFKNILSGKIEWPNLTREEELKYCSPEAKDLILNLLEMDPTKRLGVNGVNEIKCHDYFKDIDWGNLWEGEGSFKPVVDDPESTDYFENRGAVLTDFPMDDVEDMIQDSSPAISEKLQVDVNKSSSCPPSASNSPTQKHLSLAIPLHMRERRPSRLGENNSEFGSFQFRNLSALEKANKDVINRIKAEHLEHRNSVSSSSSDSGFGRPRNYSITSSNHKRSSSPSASIMRSQSPSNNQPLNTPLFSNFINEEYLNSPYSERSGRSSPSTESGSPSAKGFLKPNTPTPQQQSPSYFQPRNSRHTLFNRTYSDFSPSSSDTEDSKFSALERVRKRRQSSKMSDNLNPRMKILDVLLCEPIPIYRYSLKKDLESLGCAVVGVSGGEELIRRATGEVKFDLVLTALKIGKLDAFDIVKLLKNTSSINSDTPIVAVTAYFKEASSAHVFNDVLEKPIEKRQLQSILHRHCRYKIEQAEEAVSDTEDDNNERLSK
ncbi:hypothetical protein WICMUC_002281 [Wickerhamomyces mucosus]|uniref:non-specific serine/threonine protein kinase n=1 Tax=Wickerhamomyces mucosus TaxID=1378264 RepID=A0A9P8PQS9_9ASCO|nr:hypothetical protein WICMUC_002281 [Wickerhamomyces mucosus]